MGVVCRVQCFWGGRERVGVQLELLSRLWWINPGAPGGYCLPMCGNGSGVFRVSLELGTFVCVYFERDSTSNSLRANLSLFVVRTLGKPIVASTLGLIRPFP